MAEHHHHHHLHHKADEETGAPHAVDYSKEEKKHKHREHAGELGAMAAGAYALYEKHKAKKDPGERARTQDQGGGCSCCSGRGGRVRFP
ncbi:hypothetical protein MLD38_001923 [Melastoma candidum]|uniref:Uncharacterized protein n=1 Tax=Melastoma candidum TaxID=119954 RepID=A0ACB9SGR7_9MYRT|nr:hypothetical protein MLD38_001923 [Melastoma candidum]